MSSHFLGITEQDDREFKLVISLDNGQKAEAHLVGTHSARSLWEHLSSLVQTGHDNRKFWFIDNELGLAIKIRDIQAFNIQEIK